MTTMECHTRASIRKANGIREQQLRSPKGQEALSNFWLNFGNFFIFFCLIVVILCFSNILSIGGGN